MSKVYVNVVVGLIIDIDDGVELSHVLNEMDYEFHDTTGKAIVLDQYIKDYNLEDSK